MNFNWFIGITILVFYAIIDILYVLYTLYIVKRRPFATANVACSIYGLVALGTVSYTSNPAYIPFVVVGSWLGTYYAAKYMNPK